MRGMTPVPPIGPTAALPGDPERRPAAVVASFLFVLLAGCGYHLVGHSSTLPTGIQSVGIPTFVNRTNRPELEQRVTEHVIDEFTTRGRVRILPGEEGAQAVLRGEILGYTVTPVVISEQGRATRYEIRRAAAQDDLTYAYWNGDNGKAFNEFFEYCDEFLALKHQPKLDRLWVSAMAKAELLEVSRIADASGNTLVWHGYHRNSQRATLLYSASLFRDANTAEYRNKVGRANRYLHWEDIKRLKTEGISTYDFGGWYEGSEDKERLRINKFKEQFGGEIVRNYICERGLTLKGALFLRLRRSLLGNAI